LSKAAEAFRNIGELSDELGIKKHVLRFWEQKFPQLKPMKRGGGRRLYRPSDVELLRGIRDLLQNAGYTIKGVQKLLREHGVEHVKHAGGQGSVGRASAEQRSAAHAGSDVSVRLDAAELEALRRIAAELTACRTLLEAAGREPRVR
jgi:DNA-binding transcriptional MerR regulator